MTYHQFIGHNACSQPQSILETNRADQILTYDPQMLKYSVVSYIIATAPKSWKKVGNWQKNENLWSNNLKRLPCARGQRIEKVDAL